MVDETVIITTLGAALITGGLGYYAAHLQGRTAHEALEAENQRLVLQLYETRRAERGVAYKEFLDIVFSFPLMAKGYKGVDADGFQEWFERFQNRSHGVMLVGSEPVVDAAKRLDGVLLLILQAYKDNANGSVQERLRGALEPRDADLQDAYLDAQDTMRADVSQISGVPSP